MTEITFILDKTSSEARHDQNNTAPSLIKNDAVELYKKLYDLGYFQEVAEVIINTHQETAIRIKNKIEDINILSQQLRQITLFNNKKAELERFRTIDFYTLPVDSPISIRLRLYFRMDVLFSVRIIITDLRKKPPIFFPKPFENYIARPECFFVIREGCQTSYLQVIDIFLNLLKRLRLSVMALVCRDPIYNGKFHHKHWTHRKAEFIDNQGQRHLLSNIKGMSPYLIFNLQQSSIITIKPITDLKVEKLINYSIVNGLSLDKMIEIRQSKKLVKIEIEVKGEDNIREAGWITNQIIRTGGILNQMNLTGVFTNKHKIDRNRD